MVNPSRVKLAETERFPKDPPKKKLNKNHVTFSNQVLCIAAKRWEGKKVSFSDKIDYITGLATNRSSMVYLEDTIPNKKCFITGANHVAELDDIILPKNCVSTEDVATSEEIRRSNINNVNSENLKTGGNKEEVTLPSENLDESVEIMAPFEKISKIKKVLKRKSFPFVFTVFKKQVI